MRRSGVFLVLCVVGVLPGWGRQEKVICGTNRERWKEDLFLHRQAVKARATARARLARLSAAPGPVYGARPDIGNIAILEDSDGVVARRNDFNLDNRTLSFLPTTASHYKYQVSGGSYDSAAAANGATLTLSDDDTKPVALPFSFPFFGASYSQVFVNSDGNLTFTVGEDGSTDRSLGRMNAGPPRISPLFEDLDPSRSSNGVTVLADAQHVVISWVQVPEYSDAGLGAAQTFQVRLYPDGHIEFTYSGISTSGAVVGIAPGNLQGSSTLVDFATAASGDYAATVAERFGGTLELDAATAAQRFYETHDDAYDYLVFYNDEGISAGASAVSWEETVRNTRSGYGDGPIDIGRQYGSRARLQAVLNMGPLSQYPLDPNAIVPARRSAQDTPTTVLAHETGHLFLAYASIRDPNDPAARPMLGYQLAHWNFAFNSDASLLEGNRIQDQGAGTSPRFETVAVTQWYSPLDQYLMGFRSADEVEPAHTMFLVTGVPASFARRQPQAGVGFDGQREDIAIQDIIDAEGRRTPDYTVSQRRFRFAFILVVPQGQQPTPEELAQLDAYRTSFEAFYQQASTNRALADTSLKHALALSAFPAAGVLLGGSAPATLTVQSPPQTPLTVALSTQNGNAAAPASVTIPAGATSASFNIAGVKSGVEVLTATPADAGYDSASANLQVAAPTAVKLVTISGDNQVSSSTGPLANPIVVQLTDVNNLPYAGVRLTAQASSGNVTPAAAVTDAGGAATFRWNTGTPAAAQLSVAVDGAPVGLTVKASSSIVTAAAVVNAASGTADVTPGSLATIYGDNLAAGTTASAAGASWPSTLEGVRVLVNGDPAPLLYVSDQQINFLVPPDLLQGSAALTVANPHGTSAALSLKLAPFAPGIFFDAAAKMGAVLVAGTGQTTGSHPVRAGEYLEIYCTGLGPVTTDPATQLQITASTPAVTVAGRTAKVVFSGLAPGLTGVYQVDAQVPDGVPSGLQPLVVTIGGVSSNTVNIGAQ